MAQTVGREDAVSVEELVLVQMFESEALLNVLERKGLIRKAQVLVEARRLKEEAAKGRWPPRGRTPVRGCTQKEEMGYAAEE